MSMIHKKIWFPSAIDTNKANRFIDNVVSLHDVFNEEVT